MIERETVIALIEAREKLDYAINMLSGLRTLLGADSQSFLKDDIPAVQGALLLVQEGVLHGHALIGSILDKGR